MGRQKHHTRALIIGAILAMTAAATFPPAASAVTSLSTYDWAGAYVSESGLTYIQETFQVPYAGCDYGAFATDSNYDYYMGPAQQTWAIEFDGAPGDSNSSLGEAVGITASCSADNSAEMLSAYTARCSPSYVCDGTPGWGNPAVFTDACTSKHTSCTFPNLQSVTDWVKSSAGEELYMESVFSGTVVSEDDNTVAGTYPSNEDYGLAWWEPL